MTISEAIRKTSADYDLEVMQAARDRRLQSSLTQRTLEDYAEIDQELPGYVAQIAASMGVPSGTILPDYVYQMARMVFRMGMRVQRKLDATARAGARHD